MEKCRLCEMDYKHQPTLILPSYCNYCFNVIVVNAPRSSAMFAHSEGREELRMQSLNNRLQDNLEGLRGP